MDAIKRLTLFLSLFILTSTALASGFAVRREGTKVAPDMFVWFDSSHTDLNFSEGSDFNSSFTDGNYNAYILGVGRWVLPDFLVGVAFLSTDGLYKNQLNTVGTAADPLDVTRNDSNIRSSGFQPFMSYLFSDQFFMDMTGGFNWTNTNASSRSFRPPSPFQTNHSVTSFKGYNWNFAIGLNVLQPLPEQKLQLGGRVGYLVVSSHTNSYMRDNFATGPAVVNAITATRNSVIGSLMLKSFWMQQIRPFVRLDALYDFAVHPNQLVLIGQGLVPTPNLNLGRFQFGVRGGAEVPISRNLIFRFSYQYTKRNNLTQNSYLLNANLEI